MIIVSAGFPQRSSLIGLKGNPGRFPATDATIDSKCSTCDLPAIGPTTQGHKG